jgi:hypothetical protein
MNRPQSSPAWAEFALSSRIARSPPSFHSGGRHLAGVNLVFTVISPTPRRGAEDVVISRQRLNFTLTVVPTATPMPTSTSPSSRRRRRLRSSTTLGLGVRPVNDPPSFTLTETNLTVLDADGPQTRPNWAVDMVPGPTNESRQTLTFLVSNNASNLFLVQPPGPKALSL